MSIEIEQNLQIIWEQLNACIYDITQGQPDDALPALSDSIKRLETILPKN